MRYNYKEKKIMLLDNSLLWRSKQSTKWTVKLININKNMLMLKSQKIHLENALAKSISSPKFWLWLNV